MATAAAITTALLAGTNGATASAADPVTSTPVPISTPDGVVMSYVLNARIANP